MICPVVDSIEIPIDLERFIPPDLESALNYYPQYVRAGGRQPIQPFLLCVVKEYAKYERKRWDRRIDEDEVLRAFFYHVGLPAVFEAFSKGKAALEEVRCPSI